MGAVEKNKNVESLEAPEELWRDVLGFMGNDINSLTNNRGEEDIRITTVELKILGCFRPIEGVEMFWRIQSYIG